MHIVSNVWLANLQTSGILKSQEEIKKNVSPLLAVEREEGQRRRAPGTISLFFFARSEVQAAEICLHEKEAKCTKFYCQVNFTVKCPNTFGPIGYIRYLTVLASALWCRAKMTYFRLGT